MKKIGLVGGTGPESTLMYYRELNLRIDERTGGKKMPDLVIESVDFRRAWDYVSTGKYDLLADYLAEKVNNLKKCGAEVIALTAGTMHIVSDEIVRKTHVPLLGIPQAVCMEAGKQNYRKVGLLGTIFTMENDFMKKDFRDAGIDVFVPDPADRQLIAKRIYEELEYGIAKDSTLREFQEIIRKMQEQYGIEAVILGCTELPLLLEPENCPLPLLDSVEIHIEELIREAMDGETFRKEEPELIPTGEIPKIIYLTPQLSIDVPENAVYRKTTHMNDGNGSGIQKDYFYDKHDNPVCLVDTTVLEKNPRSTAGAVIKRKYTYNEDGTIAEQVTSGDDPFGKVTISRFQYNQKKKVCLERRFEDGSETGTISYDYDGHDNPVRVSLTSGDNVICNTQGIKYSYDGKGRITYKEMVYHSAAGSIRTVHTWYEYDEWDNVVLEKSLKTGEERPEWRKNFYDGNKRLIKSVRYLGEELLTSEEYEYEYF